MIFQRLWAPNGVPRQCGLQPETFLFSFEQNPFTPVKLIRVRFGVFMWFGAVSVDCAVFFDQGGADLAVLMWQRSCFLSFENMKTVNFPPSDPWEQVLLGGLPLLERV